MTFEERISNIDYPRDFETTIAYFWIHPHTLPHKLISLGSYESLYKMPPSIINYTTIFGEPLPKPITVPIVSFNDDLFKNNKDITELVLSPYISTLPEESFIGMESLQSIWIPRRLKHILKDCFKNCNNLTNVYYEGTKEEYKEIEVYYKRFKVIPKLGINDEIVEYYDLGNLAFLNAKVRYNVNLSFPPSKEYVFKPKIKIKGEEIK